jgi:segregation and condensation protein B
MTDLEKKIINILYLSGEEVSVNDVLKVLNNKEVKEIENTILENIKNNLEKLGLVLIKREELKNEKIVNAFLSINTNPTYTDILKSFVNFEIASDLTPAQLQTLTIVAYLKQASAQEVSFIRGIQSIQTLRALSTRGLIKKIGEKYNLTLESLQSLSITKVEDLKDFEKLNANLVSKLSDALNG